MRTLLTAIFVDPFASMSQTPEEEVAKLIKEYSEELRPAKLDTYQIQNILQVRVGTDLVLFDYGGMTIGNDLIERHSRDVVRWAIDNPSALVMIVSSFTYDRAVRYEINEALGLDTKSSYDIQYDKAEQPAPNIKVQNYTDEHLGIPAWFFKWATEDVRLKVLPVQRFFVPRKSFINFMVKNFAKKNIFDVGAGIGHVAKMLSDTNKFGKVPAVDLLKRESEVYPVYITDAREFPFPSNCVLMFCRPCHGLFVEDTIRKAVGRKVKAIIYVGLKKNKVEDLGQFSRRFTKKAANVGEDGEDLWVWKLG